MYEATRAAGFGRSEAPDHVGTYVLSAGFYDDYFNQAQKVRSLIARDFDQVWEKVDLCSTPTRAQRRLRDWLTRSTIPSPVSERSLPVRPASRIAGTVGTCLARRPGPPLGLQIIGKAFDERACRRGPRDRAARRFTIDRSVGVEESAYHKRDFTLGLADSCRCPLRCASSPKAGSRPPTTWSVARRIRRTLETMPVGMIPERRWRVSRNARPDSRSRNQGAGPMF